MRKRRVGIGVMHSDKFAHDESSAAVFHNDSLGVSMPRLTLVAEWYSVFETVERPESALNDVGVQHLSSKDRISQFRHPPE